MRWRGAEVGAVVFDAVVSSASVFRASAARIDGYAPLAGLAGLAPVGVDLTDIATAVDAPAGHANAPRCGQ